MTTVCPYCWRYYEVTTLEEANDPDRMCPECFLAAVDEGPDMEEERI